jgi:hypothetical protein
VQRPHFLPHHLWKMFPGTVSMFLSLIISGAAVSRTPEFPAINVVKGVTAAGHPYLNGGGRFDGQRAVEQMSGPCNLKLILARRSGLPPSQVLVVIRTNA